MAITRFSRNFPSLVDQFLEGDLMDWGNTNYSTTNTTLPRVNIRENNDEFLIDVAAPGMKKSDFKINYDNGKLTISSNIEDQIQDDEHYMRREFSYQSFQRLFDVAERLVEGDKISAKYVDGILQITLPKREEIKPKPAKEIAIS
ncbi:MAG TPA: Hsp20/alpha crystallin family protein [Sunxiuqinia sp.]|nr:Hsp20/alpha crystallin family protein [Sunxiuqinia sp.]